MRERFGKPARAFAPAMSEGARARAGPRAVRSPARGGELSFALFAMVTMKEKGAVRFALLISCGDAFPGQTIR